MKKLKIVLQSNTFYLIFIFFVFCYSFIYLNISRSSKYGDGNITENFKVLEISKKDDKTTFTLKGKEKIIATSYKATEEISIGDIIQIQGKIETPNNNTIPNTFNYKNYLYNNKIYKTLKISNIKKVKSNTNFFYKIKNMFYKRCQSNEYLNVFILNDKTLLDDELYSTYQKMGIIFLISASGINLSFLIMCLEKLFNKRKYFKLGIFIFLLFYGSTIGFSFSALKIIIIKIINFIFKKLDLKGKTNRYILTIGFIFLINPFYLFNIGFLFWIAIIFAMNLSKYHYHENKIINSLKRSFYIFLFTLPILININFEINITSFIFSFLFLIPFVYIIYPFSWITFLMPNLMPFYNLLIKIVNKIIYFLNNLSFVIIMPKLNAIKIILYYVLLIAFVYFRYKNAFIILLSLLVIYKYSFVFDNNFYVYYFDVNQGDSIALIYPKGKEIVMIDTGNNSYITKNILLFLKSKGITKIDNLILSHGDSDHLGTSEEIIQRFNVKNVVFNCGDYNDLEKSLINKLNENNIKYYFCISNLNFDKYQLKFLTTKNYDNENDNSNVIYLEFNGYKFLFMGDAGIEKENDIVKKYNISNVDFLKIGHHGSNTSSSRGFIDKVSPRYSVISVGKNNSYGHPKKEVLDMISKSKVYRTDQVGSIEVKINKSGYKIKTYSPQKGELK